MTGRESADGNSNLLETVPTNSQLVLKLLREAEHASRPLPPPPAQYDHPEDEDDVDDGVSWSSSSEGDASDREDEHQVKDGKMHAAVRSMGQVGGKAKRGTRARMRKAWDKVGRAKEEVRDFLPRVSLGYRLLTCRAWAC